MPDWIAVIILGIIEGFTEFIPISSTGHLLIAEHWLPRQTDLFNVVIQCGAVLAVAPLFSVRLTVRFDDSRFAGAGFEPPGRDGILLFGRHTNDAVRRRPENLQGFSPRQRSHAGTLGDGDSGQPCGGSGFLRGGEMVPPL